MSDGEELRLHMTCARCGAKDSFRRRGSLEPIYTSHFDDAAREAGWEWPGGRRPICPRCAASLKDWWEHRFDD